MNDYLSKTKIELLIEDKVHEMIKQNLEIHINKRHEYGMAMDDCAVEVEIWYGDDKIDTDFVTVKD
jgi:hypothetical protein